MKKNNRTIKLLSRFYFHLTKKTKNSLLLILPVAIITGLVDVAVVGVVSRLFTIFIDQPNSPSIPFQDFIPSDPKVKVIWLVIFYIIQLDGFFTRAFTKSLSRILKIKNLYRIISKSAKKNSFTKLWIFFNG